ncbi:MAG: DUF2834 domain-containing protein [Cyanobacteria bacterium J06648_11]
MSASPARPWLRRVLYSGLWIALVVYATAFAPPDRPEETRALLETLISGNVADLNPLLVAEFNLMGVLPLAFWCVLLADGRGQKLPAWPFAALMMGVGGFALLPYMAWRQPVYPVPGKPTIGLKLWDSRWIALLISLGALVLLGYGLAAGDFGAFWVQWRSQRFVHVMTLDFILLCALLPVLIYDDLPRRHLEPGWPFWATCAIPLLGPLAYLCWRPRLTFADPQGADRSSEETQLEQVRA